MADEVGQQEYDTTWIKRGIYEGRGGEQRKRKEGEARERRKEGEVSGSGRAGQGNKSKSPGPRVLLYLHPWVIFPGRSLRGKLV